MSRVLVVYGSRHRATAGIAERIAEVLRSAGVDATLADAVDRPDAVGFDAYVVGSGIQMGHWYKEALAFLQDQESKLATKPVWLFSSGPLPGSSMTRSNLTDLELAFGPQDGPGSGGWKEISAKSSRIHPRDHRVLSGAFDPKDPPKSMPERLVRLMAMSKRVLPSGDFRDWDAIEGWARGIAAALVQVPVA